MFFINTIPVSLHKDRYWSTIIYLFKSHYRLNDVFTTKYFDMENQVIKVAAIKKTAGPWSHTEKIMLNLALHLFNERNKFNLADLDYLDDNNKSLALEAIKIRFFRG